MKILNRKKYSILSSIIKYRFIFIFVFVIIAPMFFVGAATPAITSGITNPLGTGPDTLPGFIEALINIVLIIAVPLLVLAIIYSGFLFVKAQGNSGELEVAKRTLLYTVIGGLLLLGSLVIAEAIKATVDDIKSGAN